MSGIKSIQPNAAPPRPSAPEGAARAGAAANTATNSAVGSSPWGERGEPRTDAFDPPGVARGSAAGVEHGGLPEQLMRTRTGVAVNHGSDPGDYYCEHMFFSAQTAALRPGSSVAGNAEGEKLVGFVHLPRDRWSEGTGGTYTQDQRHAGTREVIGNAMRGYYDAAARQAGDGPVRMLVTGYAAFSSMRDNPTGDFVTHRENLDASMRQAFGDNLVSAQGERVSGRGDDATYRYQVRDPQTGRQREVLLNAVQMPVADEAIDGTSERSVQRTMDRFQPHAVISMGVNPGGNTFLVEHHADAGGLAIRDGRQVHDDSQPERLGLPENYSLARAISGAGAPRVAAADLAGRGVSVRG